MLKSAEERAAAWREAVELSQSLTPDLTFYESGPYFKGPTRIVTVTKTSGEWVSRPFEGVALKMVLEMTSGVYTRAHVPHSNDRTSSPPNVTTLLDEMAR